MKLIEIFGVICLGSCILASRNPPRPPPGVPAQGPPTQNVTSKEVKEGSSIEKSRPGWGNNNGGWGNSGNGGGSGNNGWGGSSGTGWGNGNPGWNNMGNWNNANNGWGSGNGWENSGGSSDTVPTYETPPSCLDRQQIPIQNHYDPTFVDRLRIYHVTGSSRYGYITYARMFLGRYPRNQKELNEMCFQQAFGSDLQINSGYGVQFMQNCTGENQPAGQHSCPTLRNPTTYDGQWGVRVNTGFENQLTYLVKTDSKTYAIFYLCNDGLFGDYQLVTTRPYVHPEVVNIFIDTIKRMGFHVSESMLLTCSPPTFNYAYPHPFDRYPHSSGNEENPGWGWIQEGTNPGWGQESIGWGPAADNPSGWGNSNGWGNGNNGWDQSSGWGNGNNGWDQSNGWGNGNGGGGGGNGGWGGHDFSKKKEAKKSEDSHDDTKPAKVSE